jgi:hypothetical protein
MSVADKNFADLVGRLAISAESSPNNPLKYP